MREHYQHGCNAKDPTSCRQLGVAYLEGVGLPKTAGAAAIWLERACKGDDPIGCRLLGMMKYDGVGVPRDREAGVRALKHACDRKDTAACDALKRTQQAGSTAGSGRATK
jgi:hypothetical protein